MEGVKYYKPSAASRRFSRIKKLKQENFQNNLQKEKSKQSSMFQSRTRRFITPKPQRLEDLTESQFTELGKFAGLMGRPNVDLAPKEMLRDKHSNTLLMTSYAATFGKAIPFSSGAPRFGNAFVQKYNSDVPGPGHYAEGKMRTEADLDKALKQARGISMLSPKNHPSAAFKSESRLKHSMVDQTIKDKSYIAGPGAYNTNRSTIRKKTFNYDLANC